MHRYVWPYTLYVCVWALNLNIRESPHKDA